MKKPKMPALPLDNSEESHFAWMTSMGEYFALSGYESGYVDYMTRRLEKHSRKAVRDGYRKFQFGGK